MECLVDPKNRGPEKSTSVSLDSQLVASGVENRVSGKNLTADGEKCVKATLDKWMVAMPKLTEKNGYVIPDPKAPKGTPAKPVTAHAEIEHVVGVSPAVTLGLNEASDMVGAI